jgi:hypothetical protein
MSTHDSSHPQDQEQLTRTLRERSDDMAGSHLGLDDVKGRARGIRRRRRAMTGAAAAVVLALAVPVGLNVADLTRGNEPLPANPSPNPSGTPSVVETGEPEPVPSGPIPADGAAAPRGEDPAMTYLTGSVVHPPGREPADLGRDYAGITPYGDGWIGVDPARGRYGTTDVLGPDGQVRDTFPGYGLAVSSDGAWTVTQLEATGAGVTDLNLAPSDASQTPLTASVSIGGTVQLAGFAGDQLVAYAETVDAPDGAETVVHLTDFEHKPTTVPGLISVRGANDTTGVVSGMTSIDELAPGSCSAVVDATSGEQRWETCDYTLDRFSPDGRYVIGLDAYLDGIGGSTVAILDASDGAVLAEFTTRDLGFTGPAAWESNGTVVVATFQDGTWYLLRLRPDGTVEQALDPVEGDELQRPWSFAVTP